jgi:oligopeptidase A
MNNPLLSMTGLPPFLQIRPEHVEPAIDQVLAENRARLQELLDVNQAYTWDNLVQPLEDMEERLSRIWSPVGHMNAVVNSDELREAYNACLPKLSDYATEMGQNDRLFKAFKSIAEGPEYKGLDTAQKKIIDNALRDFRLSGIDLSDADKQRYREIMQELSRLTSKFSENLLDATQAWTKHVTDLSVLEGLPESALALAEQTAEREGKEGWLFNLEFPSYFPVLTYADSRELRREMYTAYVTRASDEGPTAGKWDNTPIMEQILALRYEFSRLLGFANYAERSIATKMAASTDQVTDFLQQLAERSLPVARQELEELRQFAHEQFGTTEMEAWDVAYYSEKLRQKRYSIAQEELKPYFPETRVVPGMFAVVEKLYGLKIRQVEAVDTWHKDVRFYEILDRDDALRGQFYLDLYARPNKRGGAWMDECISRKRSGDKLQYPVAYLTCNFSPPIGDKPALFTHNEVETLFHEFGHGLHHMLTQVDYPSVSGISGVAWDAVELPSQFMENWCWEKEALDLFARHYETGETMPDELFGRMNATRHYQAAMQMLRQIEFALFDMRMHRDHELVKKEGIQRLLDEVREEVSVVIPPDWNRFQHGFSHVFAGGYAAGYYSYKWAEVLSADAFSRFEEEGLFNDQVGKDFLHTVLELGGSRKAIDIYKAFRGREPSIDALLRHSGLAA